MSSIFISIQFGVLKDSQKFATLLKYLLYFTFEEDSRPHAESLVNIL